MSARLPRAFESAIEAVIANSITSVDNKSTTLTLVVTADSIETYPTAWSMFPFSWEILL
jgi:hypothetical protein